MRTLTFSLALCLFAVPALAGGDVVYVVHEPVTRAPHPPLLVLLHGSGADERDMIGLWHDLPASLVVVSPRAPFPGPGGGWRWYRKGPTQNADIAASRTLVDVVVANAVQRFDADPTRIFLGGFSQGAVMTYEVALRKPGRFRGAAVLSGILFPTATTAIPALSEVVPTDVFVAHGTGDQIMPFASATAARAGLTKIGRPTEFHAYSGMAHTIGAEETRDPAKWLSIRIVKLRP